MAFWIGERYWKPVHRVQLAEYIGPGWDEAVNWHDYRSRRIAILVNRRFLECTGAEGGRDACPFDAEACRKAATRYGDFRDTVLHQRCPGAIPPSRPWWKLW